MRVISLLCTTLVVACFNPTYSHAQGGEQHRSDEQPEPYHKHHDTRHGHDHFYPDRGSIVRDIPKGTVGLSYAGVSYRYHDGIWLEARGPAYMVVAPPIGLVAPTLPLFSTIVTHGGETFLYANDTYYRPRPDLAGYEVVNDPVEELAQAAPEALVGGQLPAAAGPAQASVTTPASVIAAGFPVPVSSVTAAVPAAAQTSVTPVASQALSFAPPASASVTAGVPSAANATSTAGPAATAGLAATAGSAAVPVALTAGSTSSGQKGPKVFLYPKNGQSSDQQAHDRYDCYRFAVAQSGFDPMHTGGASPAPAGEMQSDYERAQGACFEARGYSSR